MQFKVWIVDYPDWVDGPRLLLQSQTGSHAPFVMGIPHKHCEIHNPNTHAREHHAQLHRPPLRASQAALVRPTRVCFICANKRSRQEVWNLQSNTRRETSPFFFFWNQFCWLRGEYSTHRIERILWFSKGVEGVRESESERDVGFELIAEGWDDGSNYRSSDTACTRAGVPQPWHTTIQQSAGSCSRRVRKWPHFLESLYESRYPPGQTIVMETCNKIPWAQHGRRGKRLKLNTATLRGAAQGPHRQAEEPGGGAAVLQDSFGLKGAVGAAQRPSVPAKKAWTDMSQTRLLCLSQTL